MITLSQAYENWESEIKPSIVEQYGENDFIALSESWSAYTDSLCKDGEISELAYRYCPPWDDDMPDDDIDYILDRLKIEIGVFRIGSRDDGLMDTMPEGSTHWDIRIIVGQIQGMAITYSMGPELSEPPGRKDAIHCLLMEYTEDSGFDERKFEYWCDNLGYDSNSRNAEKIYRASIHRSNEMRSIFGAYWIEQLQEIFQDY